MRGVSTKGYTSVADQLGIKRETLRRWVLEHPGPVESQKRLRRPGTVGSSSGVSSL